MRLSDVAVGRDNNFNLIRLLAALAVVVSHGFAVVTGPTGFEPLERALGYTLGSIAVDVFFASSGFLVCGSLLRLQSVRKFARARILRIYPGLIAAVCITVFVLGPNVSTLSVHEYLLDPATYSYLVRNAVLMTGIEHTLPGVFADLPQQGVVNGSLWTLPVEVAAYAALAMTWAVLKRLRVGPTGMTILLLAAAVTSFTLFHATRVMELEIQHAFRLFFMFFGGALLYLLKARIHLDWRIATALAMLVLLSTVDATVFIAIYPLCAAYLVLSAAYAPGIRIRNFNRVGDYSYGIYIYAFPIHQCVLVFSPAVGPGEVIGWTLLFVIPVACISWHCIEKPFLDRKMIPQRAVPPVEAAPIATD